ncbi:ABC transporter G family member 43-like isoform X1 [Pistacia vera]|uniref:ABC transporter G family member 43-like isoform X1 n=1 Tax=Pistacia vera TaxID=55513 RepID=UPI0012639D9F|nr:ABC transporter G family member 43-like isoform X1 [Pistacia vera]
MNSVRALGFVSTMSIMLINLVQFPLYMLQRPIFYKHRAKRFFRTSSYVVAHCIVNFPQTFIEALVYTLCVYFLAGLSLAGNVTPFLEYLVLLFLVAYFGSSVFFFLSAISSIPEVGNSLAGLLVSIFLLFSGFVIYPSNVPTYWKWLIYVNPIHWANVLFCKYQFSEGYRDPCSNYRTQLPFCDQFPTMTVGKAYLTFYELSEDAKRTWLPYAILLGWIVLANFLALWGLKNIEFTGTSQSLPYLRKTPKIKDYDDDSESELQTQNTNGNSLDEFSRYSAPQNLYSEHDHPNTSIKEYHIDMEESGLGIPVEPVTLLFENLSFSRYVEGSNESTPVFSYITGYAKPQNMLTLLGGSRTSKATLLKCLAGRIPLIGSFNGNLQTSGFETGASSRLIGYVEKLDAHQPYLSVRESLQFSAALRLGKVISPMNRHIHVELVLNQLGLLPYCNQLVGSLRDATGKTFEIAKKITIAVELAANPSILLLEEPVSGLDTTGTLNILNILSQVSNSGRTIVVSLTHPNARTLSFFDLALILTKEGNQAYFGPTGSNCDKMLEYFTSICKTPPYSRRESPVSYIMGALGLGITKRGNPSINFAEIYKASTLQETNNNEISIIKKFTKNKKSKNPFATYPTPYSLQAVLVLLRTQRFLWRNVQYTYGRLTGCIMIGLLMGSLYFQIEYSDTYGATSRSLYIYMQVILIGVISANNVIPQIGTDRLVYFREKRSGMYLPIFYPLSWAVGEIPYFFIATLAVAGIGNGMAGIGTGSAAEFFKYWIVLFMFTLCVTYFGMMITFLAPVPTLAAFAVSIVTSLWVSASGVVVVLSDIKFYQWMYWTNPFQYAINAMTAISFYCDTKNCGSECRCPRLPDGSYVWDRLATGRSLSYERIEKDILILSAMCVLFSSLAFLFSVVLKHNSPPNV